MNTISLDKPDYVTAVPGESHTADAYNILAASVREEEHFALLILRHMNRRQLEDTLGAMTGMFLAAVFTVNAEGEHNYGHINYTMSVLRNVAVQDRDEVYKEHGLPMPEDSE